jgi:hypothetical protein
MSHLLDFSERKHKELKSRKANIKAINNNLNRLDKFAQIFDSRPDDSVESYQNSAKISLQILKRLRIASLYFEYIDSSYKDHDIYTARESLRQIIANKNLDLHVLRVKEILIKLYSILIRTRIYLQDSLSWYM